MKKPHPTPGQGLSSDLESSAKLSDQHLNKVFRQLFPRAPQPRTYLERNNAIYDRLGFIPSR